MNRRSIEIASLTHENPIPAACRIGPLIVSGNIIGFDPGTRRLPPSFEAQVANLFIHMGEVLAEAGAGWDDVAKINVVANDSAVKAVLNPVWIETFADPASRPARHTRIVVEEGPPRVTCDFIAFVP